MREIKFRAWHKTEQRMYAVATIYFSSPTKQVELKGHENAFAVAFTIDEEVELLQFIGLYDRSGKDIYEGDILEIEGATAKVVFWEIPPEFGLDFYHNEEAWCEDWNLADDHERMEVIGNIYEDPHLINT